MRADDFDDGLVHNHSWATDAAVAGQQQQMRVADAAEVPTPSCVVNDDLMERS